jgi:hypothetical protein
MKKIYNKPTVEVAEIETRLSMLISSDDKLDINFGQGVDEGAQLSRRHSSVWDDDEEVEY